MRASVPVLLIGVLALAGCGEAGMLDVAPAHSPTPSVSIEAGEAPSASPPAPSTPETAEPSAPVVPAAPPPSIRLPSPQVTVSALPVDGVAVVAGAQYDLYLQCRGEISVWPGGGAGEPIDHSEWIAEIGCGPETLAATTRVLRSFDADQAVPLAVIEPDSVLPLIIRVPAGVELDEGQRQQLLAGVPDATAFEVSMQCLQTGARASFPNASAHCENGYESFSLGVQPAADPLPMPAFDRPFRGVLTYAPEG